MKGKVNCTCGWSWNKSDSSVKDMYICHECGRDNSNNMKNGGWLDSYDVPQAQNGIEGTMAGLTDKGFNYNGAWGGQFQEGGEIPMAQNGKATRADSLAVYNNAKKVEDYYKSKNYKLEKQNAFVSNNDPSRLKKILSDDESRFTKKQYNEISTGYDNIAYFPSKRKIIKNNKESFIDASNPKNKEILKKIYNKKIDDNKLIQREGANRILNLDSPSQYFDLRIQPQSMSSYKDVSKNTLTSNDKVDIIKYDPLAVKPFDLLTDAEKKLRVEKYGLSGVPKSYLNKNKKPQEPVITKPNTTKQPTKPTPSDKKEVYLRDTPQVEGIDLQPIGLQNTMELNADVSGLKPQARVPKYYDVEDIVNNGKSQTNYQWYPGNNEALRQLSEESGDKRTMVPRYQSGGSLPGAAGFTYARTKGIPSEGPYAKKTMPSAQNGGWLDGYDEAQTGKQVLLNNDSALQILSDIQKRKQGKGKPSTEFSKAKIKNDRENASTKIDNTRSIPKPKVTDVNKLNVRNKTEAELSQQERLSDEAIVAERRAVRERADANPLNQGVSGFFNSENQTRQNWEEASADLESSFRMSDRPNFFDDYLNPLNAIGGMAADLGAASNQIVQQDSMAPLIGAIATPLLTGAIEGFGAKSNKQFVNNLVNPFNIVPGYSSAEKYVGNKLKNIPIGVTSELVQPILSNTSNFGNKTKSFLRNNILTDKTFNRLETVNNSLGKLNKAVNPLHHIEAQKSLKQANDWMDNWYNDPITKQKIKEVSSRFGPNSYNEEQLLENIKNKNYKSSFEANLNKLDNLLDGNPRVHKGNYGVSGYYLDFYKDQSKRQNLVDKYISPDMIASTAIHEGNHGLTDGNLLIRGYEDILQSPFDTTNFKPRLNDGSFEKHSDYLLDPTEINARISEIRYEHGLRPGENLTPERVETIINKGLFGKSKVEANFFKLINDRNKFKDMMNYVPGVIGAGTVGAAAYQMQDEESVPGMRQGGIIRDDRGQWDHPGEITEINSNDITMEGVPYPVLGISDTGDTKIMKPGGKYKFKGKKVTEFPMAKNGLRQEQKGLVNLDDLTNFTNYNKSQPGGWLSKYE